jgi:ABC-type lipoprotein export system ATPase subunit
MLVVEGLHAATRHGIAVVFATHDLRLVAGAEQIVELENARP